MNKTCYELTLTSSYVSNWTFNDAIRELIQNGIDQESMDANNKFTLKYDNVRDKYMVDHCDILLAIWDRNKSGGVWNTIKMAKKSNRKIIYIPKDLLLNN